MTAVLRAGAGRAVIDVPAAAYPVDGFTGVHDQLRARVVVLEDGADRVALTVVDQTSVFAETVDRLKGIVAAAADVPAGNALICASHTFSAPHVLSAAQLDTATEAERRRHALLRAALDGAVLAAATAAVRQLRPARAGFGSGVCSVNVNRDVRTADGWWLGADDGGVSDKTVRVGRIEDLAGRPIAVLVNYGVQSSVMNESWTDDGGKLVTADLAGATARHVEREYDDEAVALFLVGAAGDQAPYLTANAHTVDRAGRPGRADVGETGFLLVDLLGRRLGAEAVRVCESIRPTEDEPRLEVVRGTARVGTQIAPKSFKDLRPTTSHPFEPDGEEDVPIALVRLGDAVLVGVRPELTAATGIAVGQRSPFPHTMVLTMVDGAAKYMADRGSYDRITYAAMNSRYARGAAETVSERIAELLDALHEREPDALCEPDTPHEPEGLGGPEELGGPEKLTR
ncbi:Neutral/alkaline nonlysosomal ceramidase [Actinobacteria bacterium OK074]|nr:Neutral/alkaline nonlysosomal ceramidase [Actinobacteria bacterium OK074]